jgi:hypothetical protein
MNQTDTSAYHGGGVAEEVAALLGLALKIRLRPGKNTRDIQFNPPKERPRAENPATIPTLVRDSNRTPVVPNLHRTVKVEEKTLAGYADLEPKQAIALVRAASLFQQALWLCESNPSDAWLMLVSAAEVAAVQWKADEAGDDTEQLFRSLKAQWAKRLDATGDKSVTADMAKNWSHLLGATNRFIKFVMAHLPNPPERRSPISQVEWTDSSIRSAMEAIYEYRSQALHGGIPFPAPMCSPPPIVAHDNPTHVERPIGLASSSRGGVWTREALPMHLHIFVHIVHGVLMNWWEGLKTPTTSPKNADIS